MENNKDIILSVVIDSALYDQRSDFRQEEFVSYNCALKSYLQDSRLPIISKYMWTKGWYAE